MVTIFYSKIRHRLGGLRFEQLQKGLPEEIKRKIAAFRNWEDSHAALFGKLLLKEAILSYGIKELTLHDLKFDTYNKPYFEHEFDFNISHSGSYVLCAVSDTNKLGVDVEKIEKKIEIEDFKDQFSLSQWKEITGDPNSYLRFYEFWTKKEAVIKADGLGLNIPLKEVIINKGRCIINNKTWFLYPLNFGESYAAHMAVDHESIQIKNIEVNVNDMMGTLFCNASADLEIRSIEASVSLSHQREKV